MMNIDEHQTKKKLARLISDLTSSIDQRQADKDLDPVDHYEIRQVQQQFTIEVPITQSTPKHKTAYGKIFFCVETNLYYYVPCLNILTFQVTY